MSLDERMSNSVRPSYILTITYGYVGLWNDTLTNFSDRGSLVFDLLSPTKDLNTAYWIEENRRQLISSLVNGLVKNFNKKHQGRYDPYVTVVPMCHVISESLIITNSYFGE